MNVEELIKQRKARLVDETDQNKSAQEIDRKLEVFQKVRQRISENRELFLNGAANDILYVRNSIWKIIEEEVEVNRSKWLLTSYEKAEVLEQLMHTMFGYGILEPLIHDPSITEIMVNGISKIYIEQEGKLQLARDRKGEPLRFNREEELLHVIEKIVSSINRKVNESDPIVDARLPNGSRVNVVLNPVSLEGPVVTIRKFPDSPYTMQQLVDFGTLSTEMADWLGGLVKSKYNIIVSGGTGSGKTTFLNALGMFIPSVHRLITIEDAAELKLTTAENLIRLETRPANIEGKGEIRIRDLLRSALRMRPDRIIVGEVRGGEALDMLQAMNTGHDGSLSTGHANSAKDMISRLETMVLMAGLELPVQAIRQQIASAVDIIVHLSKMRDGKRRVAEVVEVLGMHNGEIQLQTLYKWDGEAGAFMSTGQQIQSSEKMAQYKQLVREEQ